MMSSKPRFYQRMTTPPTHFIFLSCPSRREKVISKRGSMLPVKTFPKNILEALDALAELGKATQDKTQTLPPINVQISNKKTKDKKTKKAVKNNKAD